MNTSETMQPGLVSIIMPAFRAESFLLESVKSVLAQTYEKWELLIVDDCSTDRTWELANELAHLDKRIRPLRNIVNSGTGLTRNVGIRAARGQYVAFLDSDDLWLPHKLERQLAFMNIHNAAFSFTSYRPFNGHSLGRPLLIPEYVSYRDLLKGNVIGCLTVLIDRTIFPDVLMPSCRFEDYATWLRLLRNGETAYGLTEDLARYRLSATSYSANKLKAARWTWSIYTKQENLSLLRSAWSFWFYAYRAIRRRC